MGVKFISPSMLPPIRAKGKSLIRVSSNVVNFSAALVDAMGLKVGDRVNFISDGAVLYIFKAKSDDAFILKTSAKEMVFAYKPLTKLILDNFGCLDLIETKTLMSIKLEVIAKTVVPNFIEGIDDYWQILPPKKYEKP